MNPGRSVIYFAYLGEEGTGDDTVSQRLSYMGSQLQWLAKLIAAASDPIEVIVPYVAPRGHDAAVHRAVAAHGFRIDPASITDERRNTFEYPGFRALQALAEASPPDRLLYYCHSKGIVQLSHGKMGLFRLHTAIGLTADLTALADDPGLTRATLFPAKFGWCFYNFFWVKAGYMAGLPIDQSDDRYHFERLVGDPADREGYRGVLPLIDRVPPADRGVEARPWYRASETASPELFATYDRYALMTSPPVR